MPQMDDRQRFILLNLIPDIGSLRTNALLKAFGSVEAVFAASQSALQRVEGIGPVVSQRIVEWGRNLQRAQEELELARKAGCAVFTQAEEGYPGPLREIYDPPTALHIKGSWIEQDRLAIGIVGSRHASVYGQETAERLAYELARLGVTVVSGLARGIDAAAHRGALKANGRTLAVQGCGLSIVYPPEHFGLAAQIAEQGALISEYPMTMPPLGTNFPRRNRIISGLSLGVVVVEASIKSGALITVDCALEQGREVFAVPGKIDSLTAQGSNKLLQDGAKLVTCVDDILNELRLGPALALSAHARSSRLIRFEHPAPSQTTEQADAGRSLSRISRKIEHEAKARPAAAETLSMSQEERMILDSLHAEEPYELDRVVAKTGLAVSTCAAVLLELELKRQVTQLPGKRFLSKVGPAPRGGVNA